MLVAMLIWLTALVTNGVATPLTKRDADFWYMNGRPSESKDKYFHESSFGLHYDSRFGDHKLEYEAQKTALRNLIRAYLTTFADLGIDTWLVHGTLLGWWWNKQVLPWDSDVDAQITEGSIYYLAAYYNMSTFHFRTPRKRGERKAGGRNYLLDINPNYRNREQTDVYNFIDARWIDTETGLFIDITAARYNLTHPQGDGMMGSKDGHEFRDTYLYPLRKTQFEGVPAKIPYKFKDFLVAEYGESALVNIDYHNHTFNDTEMRWVPKQGDLAKHKEPNLPELAKAPSPDSLEEQKRIEN